MLHVPGDAHPTGVLFIGHKQLAEQWGGACHVFQRQLGRDCSINRLLNFHKTGRF